MSKKEVVFKYIFSITFILLALLIIFVDWFRDRIDITVISLFVIAFLPWLAKYVKTLEAFGIKTEFISSEKREKIEDGIDKISSEEKNVKLTKFERDLSKPIGSKENPIVLESVISVGEISDTLEKLVLLRYYIEKTLKNICEQNYIESGRSIRETAIILYNKKIINGSEVSLINDILSLLNKAVHADIRKYDDNEFDWIIEIGTTLLIHLEILSKDPEAYWMMQKID